MDRHDTERLKEHVKEHIVEVSAHYAGAHLRKDGGRFIFRCPRCGKESLHAYPEWVEGPITGCWNGNCSLPRAQDSIRFIAEMEGLDNDRNFKDILSEGARITGVAAPDEPGASINGSSPRPPVPTTNGSSLRKSKSPTAEPELADAVYRKMLSTCILSPEAWKGLEDRGLYRETIREAGLGYLRAGQGGELMKALYETFGDDLGKVAGFYESEKAATGYWSNFAGKELVLFPYHDGAGLISTIEGRVMFGKENTERYKYLSLTGSGSHLYVFPGMGFENVEAFCEGIMGAIVAAQEGICIGSIQGAQRYRKSGGKYPLDELAGIDFGGRTIPYIPDMDDPPKPEVAKAAPDAARWLVEHQNGTPLLTILPSGKDLDEFLLMVQPQHRPAAFYSLMRKRSTTLEDYERVLAGGSSQTEDSGTADRPNGDSAPGAESNGNSQGSASDTAAREGVTGGDTGGGASNNGNRSGPRDDTSEKPDKEPREESEYEHTGPGQSPGQMAGAAQTGMTEYAPAAQLTGEQFYRADLDFPPEPPDPHTAIFGNQTETEQVEAEENEESDKGRLQRLKESVKTTLSSGARALTRLAVSLLLKTLAFAFTVALVWVVCYLALEYLTPFGAFEGMWKLIAVAMLAWKLLRSRSRWRSRRFLAGKITPGAR